MAEIALTEAAEVASTEADAASSVGPEALHWETMEEMEAPPGVYMGRLDPRETVVASRSSLANHRRRAKAAWRRRQRLAQDSFPLALTRAPWIPRGKALAEAQFAGVQNHVHHVMRHRRDVLQAAQYAVSQDPSLEEVILWDDIVLHDLSKLSAAEICAYTNKFSLAPKVQFADGDHQPREPGHCSMEKDSVHLGRLEYNYDWDRCLMHHYQHNIHHPEHFLRDLKVSGGCVTHTGPQGPLPTYSATLMILLDWMAASKTQGIHQLGEDGEPCVSHEFPRPGQPWDFVQQEVFSRSGRFYDMLDHQVVLDILTRMKLGRGYWLDSASSGSDSSQGNGRLIEPTS
jgi:hypothetical protein